MCAKGMIKRPLANNVFFFFQTAERNPTLNRVIKVAMSYAGVHTMVARNSFIISPK